MNYEYKLSDYKLQEICNINDITFKRVKYFLYRICSVNTLDPFYSRAYCFAYCYDFFLDKHYYDAQ